jgi:hypothetical protein
MLVHVSAVLTGLYVILRQQEYELQLLAPGKVVFGVSQRCHLQSLHQYAM